MNETIIWLVIFAIVLCSGSIIILFVDMNVVKKTDKKLEKFDKWYKEYEQGKIEKKNQIMKEFEEWYEEKNKDEQIR